MFLFLFLFLSIIFFFLTLRLTVLCLFCFVCSFSAFFKQVFGLRGEDNFQTSDLYNEKNMTLVAQQIQAVARFKFLWYRYHYIDFFFLTLFFFTEKSKKNILIYLS